jgi:hypothetical protein
MTFSIFDKQTRQDKQQVLSATSEIFSIGGRNLLYRAWLARSKPLDAGWRVSRDELLSLHNPDYNETNKELVIDFDPNAKRKIGLVNLIEIYAYTHSLTSRSNQERQASWTPFMLRLGDVFYQEFDHDLTPQEKQTLLREIILPCPQTESIEFLYLRGEKEGWNWGRNGLTNAAFIQGPARDFFRQFF